MSFNGRQRGGNNNRNQQQQLTRPERHNDSRAWTVSAHYFSGYAAATHVNSQNVQQKPKVKEREAFSKLLECPVCFSIPDAEIFNCEKGHSVCGQCRHQLVKCSLCAGPFNGSRNFLVEGMLAHFKEFGMPGDEAKSLSANLIPCRYKWEGCKSMLLRSDVGHHENECEYRPVRCKATNEKCPWDTFLKLSEYLGHLLCTHKINGLSEASGVFVKVDRLFMGLEINSSWPPFYLNCDGKTFLRFAAVGNRYVSWWIQLIGPDSECKKYRAVIALHSPTKPDIKISWSVPIYSIRTNRTTIEEANIASISSSQILPFCGMRENFEGKVATHTWHCNITIYRVV